MLVIQKISICTIKAQKEVVNQFFTSFVSRINNLSGSVANKLSGFMIFLDIHQGGGHETDKVATGAIDVTF